MSARMPVTFSIEASAGNWTIKGFKAANDDMITAPKSLQANFTDTTTPSGHGSILNFGNGTAVTVQGALVAPADVHFA